MKKLTRGDIKDILEYEKIRDDFRQQVIGLKRKRRVSVGPALTFLFENRDTVLFQIEEMMRVERIVNESKIQNEIDVYNELLPGSGELSATLMIEITEQEKIKEMLDQLMGIDRDRTVWLEFGDQKVYGTFEAGHSSEEKISAVHFVRFPFDEQQSRRFRAGEDGVALVVEHPNYRDRAPLSEEARKALAEDLES